MPELTPRAVAWATTMAGHADADLVRAHAGVGKVLNIGAPVLRRQREEWEAEHLAPGASRASGAGERAHVEEPDSERTCFERDRDRIVHSTAFRRLAGKTQVVVHPTDHQRTRLTHALEVAQVATSIARGVGANVTLAEAIALGHDCGHGPGGHASEDAFDAFLPRGLRPRSVGSGRGAHPPQPLPADPGRHPQPLLVATHTGNSRGRDRQLGRPHRLLCARPRGRDRGRHRQPGRAPRGDHGRRRRHPSPAIERLRPRGDRDDGAHRTGRDANRGGRGTGRPTGVQL